MQIQAANATKVWRQAFGEGGVRLSEEDAARLCSPQRFNEALRGCIDEDAQSRPCSLIFGTLMQPLSPSKGGSALIYRTGQILAGFLYVKGVSDALHGLSLEVGGTVYVTDMMLPKGVPVLAYGGKSVLPLTEYHEVRVHGLPRESDGTVYALMVRANEIEGLGPQTPVRVGNDTDVNPNIRPIYIHEGLTFPSIQGVVQQIECLP